MSRKLEDLHPLLRPICEEHRALFLEKYPKIKWVVAFTYRSIIEQETLWQLGRDENGKVVDRTKVVTNARGGKSWHNIERNGRPASLAYDVVLYDEATKPLADTRLEWIDFRIIGIDLGLECGIVMPNGSIWDKGHCCLRGRSRLTLAEARSGIDPIMS